MMDFSKGLDTVIQIKNHYSAFTYLGVLLSFLDCVLIQFMQFPGIKLSELGNKYPQVSVKDKHSQLNIQNKDDLHLIQSALMNHVCTNFLHCLIWSGLEYSFRHSVMWSPIFMRHCLVCSSCSRSDSPFSGRSSCFRAAFTGRILSLHCKRSHESQLVLSWSSKSV